MAKARIYQPDKTAMQSGRAKTKSWRLEFVPQRPYFVDNLMGWNGMTDTQTEVQLHFASQEEAVAYAQANHIAFELYAPKKRSHIRKAYADNFKFDKIKA